MKTRIVVLGAGFGGLELTTMLSEALGDTVDVTLIDKSDAFVFGYAKIDVMFGRETLQAVRSPYSDFLKPGVRFVRETVTAIDPVARKVTTNAGTYEADALVIALGADYDAAATPGLVLGENEFYTVAGVAHLRDVLPGFKKGHIVVGGCGAPFKCPPAPSEVALLLHEYLTGRGIRADCDITLVLPLPSPVPPSPDTSKYLLAAFAERNIKFIASKRVASIDEARSVVVLDDGVELPCDLFLGIPKHRAPDVVRATGLVEGDWVAVNNRTLETKFPGVYAVGDCAFTGTPKAGVFAEGAARIVAAALIAKAGKGPEAGQYAGKGTCYFEFGDGKIGRVDVDFFSGPKPTGTLQEPSVALHAEKKVFGSSRKARWFRTNV